MPSRTAIGLVYVNNLLGKPGLAFHMWTEVFVKGQWFRIHSVCLLLVLTVLRFFGAMMRSIASYVMTWNGPKK